MQGTVLKQSRAGLIRNYFGLSGADAIREIKALSDSDKAQLGSAIAREQGLSADDLDFDLVPY